MGMVDGAEGERPCASAAGTNALRTIAKGAFSGISEAQQQVIINRTEWQQWWSKHASRQKAPVPEIDFDQDMAIAVTLGRQLTGGYAIEITKVEPRGNELIISVSRRSLPPNSIMTQALTAPFHIVVVPCSRLT